MCSSSSSQDTATATSAVRPTLRHRPHLPYEAGAQIAPSCMAGVEVPAASLPSLDAFLCVVLIQPITATWAAQARRISHPEYEPPPTARLPNTAGEARRRASGDTEDGHRLRDHRGARPIGLTRTSEAPLTRHLPRSWRTPSSRLRRSTCRLRRPSHCRSPSRSSGSSPSGNSSSRPSASRSSAPPRRDRPPYAEICAEIGWPRHVPSRPHLRRSVSGSLLAGLAERSPASSARSMPRGRSTGASRGPAAHARV